MFPPSAKSWPVAHKFIIISLIVIKLASLWFECFYGFVVGFYVPEKGEW